MFIATTQKYTKYIHNVNTFVYFISYSCQWSSYNYFFVTHNKPIFVEFVFDKVVQYIERKLKLIHRNYFNRIHKLQKMYINFSSF